MTMIFPEKKSYYLTYIWREKIPTCRWDPARKSVKSCNKVHSNGLQLRMFWIIEMSPSFHHPSKYKKQQNLNTLYSRLRSLNHLLWDMPSCLRSGNWEANIWYWKAYLLWPILIEQDKSGICWLVQWNKIKRHVCCSIRALIIISIFLFDIRMVKYWSLILRFIYIYFDFYFGPETVSLIRGKWNIGCFYLGL